MKNIFFFFIPCRKLELHLCLNPSIGIYEDWIVGKVQGQNEEGCECENEEKTQRKKEFLWWSE